MASAATYRFLIVLFATVTLLSVPATARPCKTLVITSYSFTLHFDPNNNPTRNSDSNSVMISTATSTFFQSKPRPSLYLAGRRHFPSSGELERPNPEQQQLEQPRSSFGFGLFDVDSLRNHAEDFLEVVESSRKHAKDILSIVLCLLLVVAFGSFVGMGIYLIWLLYAAVPVEDSKADGDYDSIESPKKMGYVAIPTADSIPSPTRTKA